MENNIQRDGGRVEISEITPQDSAEWVAARLLRFLSENPSVTYSFNIAMENSDKIEAHIRNRLSNAAGVLDYRINKDVRVDYSCPGPRAHYDVKVQYKKDALIIDIVGDYLPIPARLNKPA